MTPGEYEARVAASPLVGGYASSSQRWRDHLLVYPDADGSTVDNVLRFISQRERQETILAQIDAAIIEDNDCMVCHFLFGYGPPECGTCEEERDRRRQLEHA